MLSRVYTLPELKTLVGTRPSGAGLRGDFVVVRREGSQILLQSRADMQRWGITGTTNGQEDVYLGHTFVTVNCSKDMSRLINGKLVTIPAEQKFTDCVSGGTQSRAGLDRLMGLVRRGKVSVVVAFKLDRLARSLAHWPSSSGSFSRTEQR